MLWRSVWFLGSLLSVLVALIPQVAWLISWLIAKCLRCRMPYGPFGWATLILVVLIWTLVLYGNKVGRFKQVVNQIEYASEDVPQEFSGYRIVHISDLHVDSFDDSPEALEQFVDLVNAQNPDIILFTGDMTTMNMANIRSHEHALKRLRAKEGVVSVLGNHDFFIYCPQFHTDEERCQAADTLAQYEASVLGWRVLRNEHLLLHRNSDSLSIVGVDNINGNQGFSTIQQGDLQKAIAGLTPNIFMVVLTHDPSHWEAEVLPRTHAQITLSGHTHAAQIRLFGWSLANLMFRECDGRYDRYDEHEGRPHDRMLYVNAGCGCTAPFRIDCPSEVTVITLTSQPAAPPSPSVAGR